MRLAEGGGEGGALYSSFSLFTSPNPRPLGEPASGAFRRKWDRLE